jgi:peptide/nickel transport system substrate-binding protein
MLQNAVHNHPNAHSSEARKIEMLNISTSTAFFAFDPTEAMGYQQFILLNLFCDTLIRISETGGIEAGISESWKISEAGEKYTFKINSRALFHDGHKISAEDIAWSISRHFLNDSKSIVKSYIGAALKSTALDSNGVLKSIHINDDQTITFTLKGPYPPFLKILSNSSFCILPKNFNVDHPIGSGPYVFDKREPNGKIYLRIFDKFFDSKPAFDSISVTFLKLREDILKAFNAKEIDLSLGVPFSDFNATDFPKEMKVQNSSSLSITSIFPNQKREIFKNQKFRKDLSSLINWIKTRPSSLSKFDEIQYTFLPKGIMPASYYKRIVETLSPESFKVKWLQTEGTHLDVVIPLGFYTAEFKKLLSNSLNGAGFSVNIRELKGLPLADSVKTGDFDMIFLPYAGSIADPDGFLDLLDPKGLMQAARIPSSKLIEELAKVRFEPKETQRLEKYDRLLIPFEEEFYTIPVAQQNLPILYRAGLRLPDTNYHFHTNLRLIIKDPSN